METYLGYYTCRYLQQYQHSPNLRFVIDGAASPGEGEVSLRVFTSFVIRYLDSFFVFFGLTLVFSIGVRPRLYRILANIQI